jgi:hypothetical protein
VRTRPAWRALTTVLAVTAAAPGRAEESAAAPERGKLATADASPVDARALELERSYAPTWTLPGRAPFDRSEPVESHALDLAPTHGLIDDLELPATLAFKWGD